MSFVRSASLFLEELTPRLEDRERWLDGYGRSRAYAEMETDHLWNVLAFLELRRAPFARRDPATGSVAWLFSRPAVVAIVAELRARGEIPADADLLGVVRAHRSQRVLDEIPGDPTVGARPDDA